MTDNQNDEPTAAEEETLDHRLKEQIKTSLDGVYRFNAVTAKYGVVWVWLLRLLTVGFAIASAACTVVLAILLLTGRNIDFGTIRIDPIAQHTWGLWLVAALAFGLGYWFFQGVLRGVSIAQETSMELARKQQSNATGK